MPVNNLAVEKTLDACSTRIRSDLVPLYESLVEFLNGRGFDSTEVEIIDNIESIKVSTTPISAIREPSSKSMHFKSLSSQKAVLEPNINQYFFWITVLLSGLFLIRFMGIREDLSLTHNVLRNFIALSFLVFGLVGIFLGFGVRKIVIDRKEELLCVKYGIFRNKSIKTHITLDEIIGFQLCYREITGDTTDDLYELNLIFKNEEVERINLATDHKKTEITKTAKQVSEFINKPMFDHCLAPH